MVARGPVGPVHRHTAIMALAQAHIIAVRRTQMPADAIVSMGTIHVQPIHIMVTQDVPVNSNFSGAMDQNICSNKIAYNKFEFRRNPSAVGIMQIFYDWEGITII